MVYIYIQREGERERKEEIVTKQWKEVHIICPLCIVAHVVVRMQAILVPVVLG